MTRRRRVPISLWRRVMVRLSKSAILAGEATGYRLAQYQVDRDTAYEALDAALQRQVDELAHELFRRRGEGSLIELVGDLQRGVDPHLQQAATRHFGPAGVATHTRAVAGHASALAAQLRELAKAADVVAVGLGLRAEDHDAEQALDELLDTLRPRG